MIRVLTVISLMMLGSALIAQEEAVAPEPAAAEEAVPVEETAAQEPVVTEDMAEDPAMADEAPVQDPAMGSDPAMLPADDPAAEADMMPEPAAEPMESMPVEEDPMEPMPIEENLIEGMDAELAEPEAAPEVPESVVPETNTAEPAVSLTWKERLKKPMGSFLASAVIPGSGELLQEEKKSGLIFLGVEVALWITYAVLRSNRENKIDTYHDHTADHFTEADYLAYESSYGTTDTAFFLESLPDRNSEQYYEVISHPQFQAGWDDADYKNTSPTSVPDTYLSDNQRTLNDQIDAARFAADLVQYDVTAVVFNHLLSAVDAFRTAKRNRNRTGLGLRYEMRHTDGEHLPWLVLEYRY